MSNTYKRKLTSPWPFKKSVILVGNKQLLVVNVPPRKPKDDMMLHMQEALF